MTLIGFPHSDIAGSKDVCSSPTLIAAYHVLHRLLVPRHPPNALSSLIKKILLSLKLPLNTNRYPKLPRTLNCYPRYLIMLEKMNFSTKLHFNFLPIVKDL